MIYGTRFAGWQGGIVCPDTELVKAAGIHLTSLVRFSNGGLKVALLKKSVATPSRQNP
jgi:hypothetical protein